MNASQLIESSRQYTRIESVTVESAAAAKALRAELKAAWVGETDSVQVGDVLDVWGWDAQTADGQQEWRVHIEAQEVAAEVVG